MKHPCGSAALSFWGRGFGRKLKILKIKEIRH
jgi:hypothetical protein